MSKKTIYFLEDLIKESKNILDIFKGNPAGLMQSGRIIAGLTPIMEKIKTAVPSASYEEYDEFFTAFGIFCSQCVDPDFLRSNSDRLLTSLELFTECLDCLKADCTALLKKCPCCRQEVFYIPFSPDNEMRLSASHANHERKGETPESAGYVCPVCGANGRDRLIISFLQKEGLVQSPDHTRLLQIAPSAPITKWISSYCPHITFEQTDLFINGAYYESDVKNIGTIADGTYDLIICSRILDTVPNDANTLRELKRILKPNGAILFRAPVNFHVNTVKEEQLSMHSPGKEYLGEDLFHRYALEDQDVLYLLTKTKQISLNLTEKFSTDDTLCQNGPLVSVIMSCYNHEEFVADAIESVISQSYKNIEFIIADDASTDQTAAIMKKYSSYYAKEFYYDENIGGRSEFLQQFATGKYIALMHSDDVWDKDKLALQVAYMEAHEDCGVCLTWALYTDQNLDELRDRIFIKENRDSAAWMEYFWESGNALCNPSSLIRRELCAKIRKNPCCQLPDFFKWIDIIQYSSIYVLPKVLVKMRRYKLANKENTSISSEANHIRFDIEMGCNWLWVLRDMDDDFFKRAFKNRMIDPSAGTKEEIKCEKYFLMLRDNTLAIQHSALCYFSEIYHEVHECMERKYHYTYKNFTDDSMRYGLAQILISNGQERTV